MRIGRAVVVMDRPAGDATWQLQMFGVGMCSAHQNAKTTGTQSPDLPEVGHLEGEHKPLSIAGNVLIFRAHKPGKTLFFRHKDHHCCKLISYLPFAMVELRPL